MLSRWELTVHLSCEGPAKAWHPTRSSDHPPAVGRRDARMEWPQWTHRLVNTFCHHQLMTNGRRHRGHKKLYARSMPTANATGAGRAAKRNGTPSSVPIATDGSANSHPPTITLRQNRKSATASSAVGSPPEWPSEVSSVALPTRLSSKTGPSNNLSEIR